ncbi:hypothetical protein HQN64_11230 [Enterobacteriaceae bacterium BIT-l23]|uniref:hypothetical protein n=1 Tax=Jejubacter sp. L23 TaxID=3092086 RepID=UPI00158579A6|nr:hypothetical protein [Enterobacteriaceae bacterium BIT-l23]
MITEVRENTMKKCLLALSFISATCFAGGLFDKPVSEDPENFTMAKVGSLDFQPVQSTSRLVMRNGHLSIDGGSEAACRIEKGFEGRMSSNHTGFYELNKNGCHILVTIDPSVVGDKITYSSTVRLSPGSGKAACRSYCHTGDIDALEGIYK